MMRFISIFFLITYMVNGDLISSTSSGDVRHLQANQTLNYRVTYKADFQYLHDFVCRATSPVLEVSCYGGAVMTILNKSDASITCNLTDDPINRNNGTSYLCLNSCTGSACTSVYDATGDTADGPFGSIIFMCESDDIRQVDATFIFVDGEAGECDFSSAQNRNYHVGRLGVSCPMGSSRDFVYDDTYAECTFIGLAESSGVLDNSEGSGDDIYTCYTGNNCEGQVCSVTFDDIYINARLPNFLDTCVESPLNITSIPTAAPQVSTSTDEFTVQFEAAWGQLFDSASSQQLCSNANPSMLITCGSGSSINYINSTDSFMMCSPLSNSELLCTGSATLLTGAFTRVIYTCVGPAIPASRVSYPESPTSCSGIGSEAIVSHAVTLGVICDIPPTGVFVYSGYLLFDCAETSHNFEIVFDMYGFGESNRYICSESATIGIGSTAPQSIRNVTISTDEYWLENPTGCYTEKGTQAPPTAIFTNPPTPSPSIVESFAPSASPTSIPTGTPSAFPSEIIVTEPPTKKPVILVVTTSPLGTRSIDSPTSSNSQSIIGIVIGSIGGGFALAALVGMIIFLRKRDPSGDNTGNPKPIVMSMASTNQQTDSNTNDDFTSSPSLPTNTSGAVGSSEVQSSASTQHPLYPITETPAGPASSTATENKRDMSTGSAHMPLRNSSTTHSSASSQRSSYPSNYVVDVKDQCRSVAMVRASSPTLVDNSNTDIPFAVALGVSTASSTSSTPSRSMKEPSGRMLDM